MFYLHHTILHSAVAHWYGSMLGVGSSVQGTLYNARCLRPSFTFCRSLVCCLEKVGLSWVFSFVIILISFWLEFAFLKLALAVKFGPSSARKPLMGLLWNAETRLSAWTRKISKCEAWRYWNMGEKPSVNKLFGNFILTKCVFWTWVSSY